jgi:hypothetical protein
MLQRTGEREGSYLTVWFNDIALSRVSIFFQYALFCSYFVFWKSFFKHCFVYKIGDYWSSGYEDLYILEYNAV